MTARGARRCIFLLKWLADLQSQCDPTELPDAYFLRRDLWFPSLVQERSKSADLYLLRPAIENPRTSNQRDFRPELPATDGGANRDSMPLNRQSIAPTCNHPPWTGIICNSSGWGQIGSPVRRIRSRSSPARIGSSWLANRALLSAGFASKF
jgi:hypothetical protein